MSGSDKLCPVGVQTGDPRSEAPQPPPSSSSPLTAIPQASDRPCPSTPCHGRGTRPPGSARRGGAAHESLLLDGPTAEATPCRRRSGAYPRRNEWASGDRPLPTSMNRYVTGVGWPMCESIRATHVFCPHFPVAFEDGSLEQLAMLRVGPAMSASAGPMENPQNSPTAAEPRKGSRVVPSIDNVARVRLPHKPCPVNPLSTPFSRPNWPSPQGTFVRAFRQLGGLPARLDIGPHLEREERDRVGWYQMTSPPPTPR